MKESTWVGRPSDTGTVDAENPWPGLAAFREADQSFFRGRETVIDDVVRLIVRSPLTVLFGISGLGKTSLLRAGIFPGLRQNGILPVYLRLRHGERASLRQQVWDTLEAAAGGARVEAPEPNPDASLWEYFHRRDVRFWNERNRLVTPLLVFDQFEEFFTVGRANADRRQQSDAFLVELADLAQGRPPAAVKASLDADPERALQFTLTDRPCKVLLSLREDFLAELTDLAAQMPGIAENTYRLQRMKAEEALRVVQVQHLVASPVAERIVEFVAASAGEGTADGAPTTIEPALLSVFCRELNLKRQAQGRAAITDDLVEGNAARIIADFYERAMSEPGLGPGVRTLIEDRLLTKSGFRDSIAEEEALLATGVSAEDIQRLIALRLIRREETGTKGYARLELTHDVLVEPIRASRDARHIREQEERKLAVLRDFELQERKRADERRRRNFILALSVMTIVALTMAGIAWRQKGLANRELSASDVERVLLGDPEPMPHLARAVAKDPDSDLPRAALFAQLASAVPRVAQLRHEHGIRSAVFVGRPDRVVVVGQDGSAHLVRLAIGLPPVELQAEQYPAFATGVDRVAVSRDGTRIVTAAGDGTVHTWSVRADAVTADDVLPPFSAVGGVADLQLTTDGTRAAVATFDGEVRTWTTTGVISIVSFSGAPAAASDARARGGSAQRFAKLRFDPGGTRLLTLVNGVARIWDATTGRPLVTPLDRLGNVLDASLSRDGRRLAAVVGAGDLGAPGASGSVQIWDAAAGVLVGPAESPLMHERVERAVFAPRGDIVATTSPAGLVRVWDVACGTPLGVPMRHDTPVFQVAFSPDGSRLLTASDDRAVRLWDARSGDAIGLPLRHHAPVGRAAFSPDGIAILTTSDDGLVHVWDARRGVVASVPVPHPAGVFGMAFSRDASTLLTTAQDGVARLWSTGDGALRAEMRADEPVENAAFSPDGTRIVTKGRTRVSLWDATGHALPGVAAMRLREAGAQHAWIVGTGFTGTGTHLVTVASDGTTTLWDARSGAAARSYQAGVGPRVGPEPAVAIAAFNPNQLTFVTAAGTRAALWDIESGRPVGRSMEHQDRITAIDYHPLGTFIVTASMDRTARLWNARTGEPVGEALHDEDPVINAAFSDAGTEVVTTSTSGSVRVWDVRGALFGLVADSRASMLKVDGVTVAQPSHGRVFTGGADGALRAWSARTGASMGPPLRHAGAIRALVVSRDGSRIATVVDTVDGAEPMARIWDVPVGVAADVPVLQRLAEALEGHRLQDDGVLIDLREAERQEAMAHVRAAAGDDIAGRFVRWFLGDPPTRAVTPLSTLAPARYVTVLVERHTASARLEARRAFGWLRTVPTEVDVPGRAAPDCRPPER